VATNQPGDNLKPKIQQELLNNLRVRGNLSTGDIHQTINNYFSSQLLLHSVKARSPSNAWKIRKTPVFSPVIENTPQLVANEKSNQNNGWSACYNSKIKKAENPCW